MLFQILTIFPDLFKALQFGVVGRAINTNRVTLSTHDIRSFTTDRHKTVDDRPFGGGEGMVLKLGPIWDALHTLEISPKGARNLAKESVVLLSAQGRPFNQAVATELASLDRVVMICGRYEGVDERVNDLLCDRELSIGDYVLSGGELAAAVILDATVRLLPGVLGNPDSAEHESFGPEDTGSERGSNESPPRATHSSGGLLDYPHYTRPADFHGHTVPQELLGGDHAMVRRWRRRMSLQKTFLNRPDLIEKARLSSEDKVFLSSLGWEHSPVHEK